MSNSKFLTLVGAFLAPALCAQDLFDRDMGTNLGLGDDTTVQGLSLGFVFPFAGVNYNSISVCSNGYLWLGSTAGNGSDPTPTLAELALGAPRIAPLWADYDPSAPGSGNVWYKALPTSVVVSWAGVYEKGTQSPVNFQVTLTATGHVQVAYGKNYPQGLVKQDRILGASDGISPLGAIDFGQHPVLTNGFTFAQSFYGSVALPYEAMRFDWSPTFPGYAISHVPANMNALPPPAAFELVGRGCTYRAVSLYNIYDGSVATPPMTLVFTPNGVGGYVVTRPIGRLPTFGVETVLQAGDDTYHQVMLPFAWPHASGTIDRIVVSSNGYLTLGGTMPAPGSESGDGTEFLGGLPRIAGFWMNLNPLAGGMVSTSDDPANGRFSVNWSAVPEYPNVGANTFRIVFFHNGSFSIAMDQVAAATGNHKALVGYTDGMRAADPGMIDLASMPVPTDLGPHYDALALEGLPGAVPAIGTTFVTKVSNLRGILCYLAIGHAMPPIDLAPIGAPDCMLLVGMHGQISIVNVVFGGPITDFPVTIPRSLDLAGYVFMTQAAADNLGRNQLGWDLSNGGRWTVGM